MKEFSLLFLSILAGSAAAQEIVGSDLSFGSRDVVIFAERTNNTLGAIQALQEGAQRLFHYYGGETSKFLFHFYRSNYESTLEPLGNPSREADPVMTTLRDMANRPMTTSEPCNSACCESASLFTNFPVLLEKHLGGIFFLIIDSIGFSTELQRQQLYKAIEDSHSLLFLIRVGDSYCMDFSGETYTTALSTTTFVLQTSEIADAFASLTSHHNSAYIAYSYSGICHDAPFYVRLGTSHQGMTVAFSPVKLNKPIVVRDPSGNVWPSTTTTVNLRAESAQILTLHTGCDAGWQYRDGLCFLRKSIPSTWSRAREDCASHNATLLRSADATTTQRILRDDSLWLDPNNFENDDQGLAFDDLSSWLDLDDHDAKQQFQWRYSNGKFLSLNLTGYAPWAPGEPIGQLLGKRCVKLLRNLGRWATSLCSTFSGYTCQKPSVVYGDGPKKFLPAGQWTFQLDSFVGCRSIAFQME